MKATDVAVSFGGADALPTLPFPAYSRPERRVDAVIHAAGVAFAFIGAAALLIAGLQDATACRAVGLPLYAFGLIAVLTCSAAYNLTPVSPAKEVLRKLDRAAIFVMIAGTYAPLVLCKIDGPWGIGLFAWQWTLALVGLTLTFALPRRAEWASLLLYLLMGWSILPAVQPLGLSLASRPMLLLVVGGLIYTGGVGFYLARRLRYHNALWHICVLAAAITHYLAIFEAVVIRA